MKRWQLWVGMLISMLFLYLALRGLQLEQVWEAVRQANYLWLLPGIGVYFIGVWVRTWRWQILLKPLKSIKMRKIFPMVAIGYMGNNIFPARLGEVLRAVVLKRREDVAISSSLATIIIERIFDGMVMLAFVFLNLPELTILDSASGFAGNIQNVAVWGAVLFSAALILFLIAAAFPQKTIQFIQWMIRVVVPKKWKATVSSLMERFISGLETLRSPKQTMMIFLTSAVIWLLETGMYWMVMQAFPFQVSFLGLMLMNGIINLITTIPSAPGYIGTFDAPGIALLQALGVSGELAAGYTLVLHATLWLPITIVGAYFFLREGLGLTQAMEQSKGEVKSHE
jgi:hypothetical protein